MRHTDPTLHAVYTGVSERLLDEQGVDAVDTQRLAPLASEEPPTHSLSRLEKIGKRLGEAAKVGIINMGRRI